jgi:hypothetical protein
MQKHKLFTIACLFGIVSLSFPSCIKEDVNPAEGTPGELLTLQSLRLAYTGAEVTLNTTLLNGASKIEGVVISDKNGKNIDDNSFVLQQTVVTANTFSDVTRGVVVKLNGASTFNPGDSLHINVIGAKLGRVNGKLTLSGISSDKVSVVATSRTPLVRAVTQGRLHTNMADYESTLVTLHADVVDYAAGATISGIKQLNDKTGGPVYLHTLAGADHSATALPMDAQFGGIAGYLNEAGSDTTGARKTIMPRNAADIQFVSGALYEGFPESFESPDFSAKSSYNSGTNIIALQTGNWTLLQGILANTAGSDRYNEPGKQGIRMQQNLTTSGYTQMNFDVPSGASKVTVFYGRYSNDARSQIRLEASTNGGTTWTPVGSTITVPADKEFRQATWIVNYTGPVRFRINKLGTGTTNNGRLSLDDFAIYKK